MLVEELVDVGVVHAREAAGGQGDLETLTARASLAAALYADGRLMEVIAVLERTLADSEQYLGPDHPMTRTVRGNLEAARRDPAKTGNGWLDRTRITAWRHRYGECTNSYG